jgi:CRISPR-associated protein Csm1
MDEAQSYRAALAGVLYNLGAFARWAQVVAESPSDVAAGLLGEQGALRHWVPADWQDDVAPILAEPHNAEATTALAQAVCVADWLVASECAPEPLVRSALGATPRIPVTAGLSLDEPSETAEGEPAVLWGYPLGEAIAGEVLFPQEQATVSPEDYAAVWRSFERRARAFPGPVQSFARMAGVLDLLAETTFYLPSVTSAGAEGTRTVPDVSLYNHLHLTAGAAVCLTRLTSDTLQELYRAGPDGIKTSEVPVARLLKIDLSGIQVFIYRITEPLDERGFRHTAKRLRGRSLYIALLNRAIGDWLARRLAVPPTNILYAAGGVVELLLPPDAATEQHLTEALRELSEGMWSSFHGDLGFVHGAVMMQASDFAAGAQVRMALEQDVARAKGRKWHARLEREGFFDPVQLHHTCPVCDLTLGEGICDLCEQHKAMGQTLPYAHGLAHSFGAASADVGVPVELPPPLSGPLLLIRSEEQSPLFSWAQRQDVPMLLQGIDAMPQEIDTWPSGSAPGRWSIANAAPTAGGYIYDFEKIAALSQGAQLLGVLRADVDRMGLHFSHGLHPPTFSRSATLSETVARFFGPYLNDLTLTLTDQWRANLDETTQATLAAREIAYRDLENLFYVLYAGGDDLFVVGPWDHMVTFALRLAKEFAAYTCGNLTLSGGLVFVKPHFPVQQFARLAGEAEHEAKSAGRQRLHIFNRTLTWERAANLIAIAQDWIAQEVPRGLLYDLGRMGRSYTETCQEERVLFTPRLYYTVVRRLRTWEKKRRQAFAKQVLYALQHHDITVPVSYVSLSTRKESR